MKQENNTLAFFVLGTTKNTLNENNIFKLYYYYLHTTIIALIIILVIKVTAVTSKTNLDSYHLIKGFIKVVFGESTLDSFLYSSPFRRLPSKECKWHCLLLLK